MTYRGTDQGREEGESNKRLILSLMEGSGRSGMDRSSRVACEMAAANAEKTCDGDDYATPRLDSVPGTDEVDHGDALGHLPVRRETMLAVAMTTTRAVTASRPSSISTR